ncbi:enoyl-CoA hydratase [Rhodococcus sp. 06-412-2C]|uniref:enoyl-CoA hydratase/isomerase family protein n=1 Tax=unclassified Rhodococcus (in: high G+C Gram-positive bacteria) TaxID=192944 RepID=UPI000B9C47BE|nr:MULTISPECIES: enoyl-CoA hydratase/isomerase family protein [unclassified Rhodococcus (in: high G+C Gram-positive bacteria)]OZC83950.1 enoyl-CoA hydratase [Rhodococcus sp. 06-412-2C]OZC94138.1 enoyl-CoA hydratase [Rhodococcus sp. 06-412-2B]
MDTKAIPSPIVDVLTVTPQIRKVVFTNPPVNAVSAEAVRRLHTVIDELRTDEQVRVVIFTSDTDGFFYNHADLDDIEFFLEADDGNQIPTWLDLVEKLSRAQFVSIAAIRGRTRGGGSEFTLACDLRYASSELASFGQIEVGTGLVPGGGGTDRLARLLGRDRALEVVLSSADYDASTAERFGWITRALPDAELDTFVDALAARISSFDKTAVDTAKEQINRVTLPDLTSLRTSYRELSTLIGQPGFGDRAAGFGQLIDAVGADEVELNLGHYIGIANQQN